MVLFTSSVRKRIIRCGIYYTTFKLNTAAGMVYGNLPLRVPDDAGTWARSEDYFVDKGKPI